MNQVVNRNQQIELLTNTALFQNLSKADIQTIAAAGQPCHVPTGAFLFHQGEEANRFFILLEGQTRLSQLTTEGKQIILHMLGPGDGMAIIVVLSQKTYPLSAEAVEDCIALSWDRDTISQLMEDISSLAFNSLHLIANRFMELQQRYCELATERVERRVARTLIREANRLNGRVHNNPSPYISLSRQDLADMAGATLYTVSRTCSGWEQDGIIKTGRGRIAINDYRKLMLIAEDLPPNNDCADPITCLTCPPFAN